MKIRILFLFLFISIGVFSQTVLTNVSKTVLDVRTKKMSPNICTSTIKISKDGNSLIVCDNVGIVQISIGELVNNYSGSNRYKGVTDDGTQVFVQIYSKGQTYSIIIVEDKNTQNFYIHND